MSAVVLIILLPFLGAMLLPVWHAVRGRHTGEWALLPPAGSFLLTLSFIPTVSRGEVYHFSLDWFPTLGVRLSLWVDGLSLLFALLICGVGLLITWYTRYYLAPQERVARFLAYILLFMGSMLGVVLSANLIALFVFWELTSISSYLLIGFWHTQQDSLYGARKALLITVFGGLALLGGLVLLYQVAGTVELPELATAAGVIRQSPFYPAILALVLLGACAKSAQYPFHIWLPDAMAAPTPVSAYLHSATMVKAGLFLVARMLPVLSGTEAWIYTVTGIGVITMFVGAVLALRQYDLKALLAYSTISQLGVIMMVYGSASAGGVRAATLHLFNHAAFKGALFLLVGIIEHEVGTRDRRELGGLARRLPVSATLTGIAALAMAGLPPFNGFISKEMVYETSLQMTHLGGWMWLLPALVVLGSVFTITYSLRIFLGVFFGRQRNAFKDHLHEPAVGMLLAPALLAGMCIFVGALPGPLDALVLAPAARSISGHAGGAALALWHGFTPPVMMSAIAFLGGIYLFQYGESHWSWSRPQTLRLSPNTLYDRGLAAIDRTGIFLMGLLQSGYLKMYLIMLLGYLALSFGYPFVAKAGSTIGSPDFASIEPFEILLILLLILGALAVPFAAQPLIAVLTLGLVGLLVSFLFVVLRAPDLALTQLLIETASLILFLLVLRHLPPFGREVLPRWGQVRDVAISIIVGSLVVVLLLIANGVNLHPSIASYFLDNSLPQGGGRNVVNVIVVDFRGYDTMGEITVLGIAAIGVYALIKLKREQRSR